MVKTAFVFLLISTRFGSSSFEDHHTNQLETVVWQAFIKFGCCCCVVLDYCGVVHATATKWFGGNVDGPFGVYVRAHGDNAIQRERLQMDGIAKERQRPWQHQWYSKTCTRIVAAATLLHLMRVCLSIRALSISCKTTECMEFRLI